MRRDVASPPQDVDTPPAETHRVRPTIRGIPDDLGGCARWDGEAASAWKNGGRGGSRSSWWASPARAGAVGRRARRARRRATGHPGGGHDSAQERQAPVLRRPTACARTRSSEYADAGRRARLPRPAAPRRHGVRQRPADPGAAEHRRRLVHADHRRVAGRPRLDQQHVPRQRPAVRATRTAAFGRRQRAAGRDARPGGRARRQEGRPDRVGRRAQRRDRRARRSTSATSARAAAWPPTTSRRPTRRRSRRVRAAVRPSRRLRRPARRSRRPRRAAATGWTNVPAVVQPGEEMRLRVLDGFGAPTSTASTPTSTTATNDGSTRYDRVLFSPHQGRRRRGRRPQAKASGPTSRSRSTARATARTARPARCSSRSSGSTRDLSQVRLFHTSVTRAIATWPTWPGEPGFTGSFEDFVAERFPSSQAGDFAVLEAGIVSEETYVEQGCTGRRSYHPLIKYVLDTYKPDLALVGYPGTDEIQHQFLGLVTKKLPERRRQPGLRRRRGQRHAATIASSSARRSSARPTRAPTRRCGSPRSTCATAT